MTQIITSIDTLRDTLSEHRERGQTIGFVPTMGSLHAGHMDLIRACKDACDITVASIFVNPMQFGPNEDFDAYPRTLEADNDKLTAEGADYLFAPTVREMYPHGVNTQIDVPSLANILCGASRPGHFAGVATVVSKLFNIVQPHQAFFGRKDFQQLAVIRQMARDLLMPLSIVGVPTGRADDGLALSSRNAYLTDTERAQAPLLYQSLQSARQRILDGETDFAAIQRDATIALDAAGFRVDYFEVRCAHALSSAGLADTKLVILVAAYLGKARLIDNVELQKP